jgi:uncharacterized membrane protein
MTKHLSVAMTILFFALAGSTACGTAPGAAADNAGDTPILDPNCPEDKPVETWDTFGKGFLRNHCQGCHASTVTDRYDAPENVIFDTREDALAQSDRIMARAGVDNPTMPPAGGTSTDERERLRLWLECFEKTNTTE